VSALHDPNCLRGAQRLTDREPNVLLAQAVLAMDSASNVLPPRDYQQIAIQLTRHARAVAAQVRLRCTAAPASSRRRELAEAVLADAGPRLEEPEQATLGCAQGRARLVRALYEQLDRLSDARAS
jgi:hypothetical protein